MAEETVLTPEIETPAELRNEMQRLVVNELLGPAGGEYEEVEESHVLDRYLVGMLSPINDRIDRGTEESLAIDTRDDSNEGPTDTEQDQPTGFCPSSFGLSCCVTGTATALRITAKWGQYTRKVHPTKVNKNGDLIKFWQREPRGGTVDIALRAGRLDPFQPDPENSSVWVQGEAIQRDNIWIVTLFLVNMQKVEKKIKTADSYWLFQAELSVTSVQPQEAIFARHTLPGIIADIMQPHGLEEQGLAMRYRGNIEFAVGHGVSIHVDVAKDTPDCATRIATQIIPSYEVGLTEAPTPDEIDADDLVLDMQQLATYTGNLSLLLIPLANAYERWIVAQTTRIDDISSDLAAFMSSAKQTIADCREALQRLHAGISLLGQDSQAASAFRFMNEAMALQRVHSLYSDAVRQGKAVELGEFDLPRNHTWRPFQLAFILINLPSLTDLQHPERSAEANAIADLLWFPTGGGKTEAYLGLTAYTLGVRRLQGTVGGRSGEGVAVLMRYTLRLLTLQQFQRATTLICACEDIRRRAQEAGDNRWGATPFRLGLWVGNRTTPNTTEQSAEKLRSDADSWRGSTVGGTGSPAQLTNCPWCGKEIGPANIQIHAFNVGTGRTIIYCGDILGQCLFSAMKSPGEGLPAVVVDEEIYRLLPALLIATVDKFAQMPWNGSVGMLFGQVNGQCPRHGYQSPGLAVQCTSHPKTPHYPAMKVKPCSPLRPPDLIIQDELHLISGPLGTLVGLYETAVDYLSMWKVDGKSIRPKVIASTATVRRAADQMKALFLRDVRIFPPQGLDADDNFFARQRVPTLDKPGRRYLGICAHGHRLKSVLIRVYVAHLAAAQTIYDRYGERADAWMTLVGYFNTIRELAGMKRLIEDDVATRLRHMERRGLSKRLVNEPKELTSRRASSEIPAILDLLETSFNPEVEMQRKAQNRSGKFELKRPIDTLLATNMISVGVDIKRLGLMVVAGQPKTTAEYIQATSRVGRTHPGLVCTVFSWTRPRDISHYEHFEHYHATFYRQVEALSVTPFSSQARSRGLSAVLAAMYRLGTLDQVSNDRAQHFDTQSQNIQQICDNIVQRAEAITRNSQVISELKAELHDRMNYWESQTKRREGGRTLSYSKSNQDTQIPLLEFVSGHDWFLFTCLNSLRDVEPSANLVLMNDSAMDRDENHPLVPMKSVPNSDDSDLEEDEGDNLE